MKSRSDRQPPRLSEVHLRADAHALAPGEELLGRAAALGLGFGSAFGNKVVREPRQEVIVPRKQLSEGLLGAEIVTKLFYKNVHPHRTRMHLRLGTGLG